MEKKRETKKENRENRNYLKTAASALLIILLLVSAYFAYRFKENEQNKEKESTVFITEDEKKFKEEYESLNGTIRTNGETNKTISIKEDNKVEYVTLQKAVEIIKSGSGVIYFGFAACPWCRTAVPILLEAATVTDLDKIYYVNVRPNDISADDIRTAYTLNQNNVPKKIREGASGYNELLELLKDVLNDYTLTTDKGKKINLNEKTLGAPTIITVKNGTVLDAHKGTFANHKKDELGNLRDLTEEERKTLVDIYTKMLSTYIGDSCSATEDAC